jgi:alkyl sulfatase BDS1-like metallo-beta-lactamase superfamily hydrolase
VLAAMNSEMLFDFLAVSLDGERAADADMTVELHFPDREERWLLEIERGVLRYSADRVVAEPTLRMTMPRARFVAVLQRQVKMTTLLRRGEAEFDGGLIALARFGGLFERFTPDFEIVTP